jgi:hypothetical protein
VLTVVADVILIVRNVSWVEETVLMIVKPHVSDFFTKLGRVSARRLRPDLAGMAARRDLVIKIEVGRAAHIFITAIRSSMPGSHIRLTLSSHVLIIRAPQVLSDTATVEVDFWTDFVALLVLMLTVLAVAVLCAAVCKQILLCWLGQQDIHIAFDLLSCRPIDLSILLQALLGLVGSFKLSLAFCPATVVDVIASQVVAGFILAVDGLAFCLHAVAFCILRHIAMIRIAALVPMCHPRIVRRFKLGDLITEPSAEVSIHFQVSNSTCTEATTIPSAVRQQAAPLLGFRALSLEVRHEIIQCAAFSNVLLVQAKESIAALLVRRPVAMLRTGALGSVLLILATLKTEDLLVELRLVEAMCFVQCTPDVSKQLLLDDLERGCYISIKLVGAIADGILNEKLEEGGHLGHIARTN